MSSALPELRGQRRLHSRLLNRRLQCHLLLALTHLGRFARPCLCSQLRRRLGQLEALGGQLLLHIADVRLGTPLCFSRKSFCFLLCLHCHRPLVHNHLLHLTTLPLQSRDHFLRHAHLLLRPHRFRRRTRVAVGVRLLELISSLLGSRRGLALEGYRLLQLLNLALQFCDHGLLGHHHLMLCQHTFLSRFTAAGRFLKLHNLLLRLRGR